MFITFQIDIYAQTYANLVLFTNKNMHTQQIWKVN